MLDLEGMMPMLAKLSLAFVTVVAALALARPAAAQVAGQISAGPNPYDYYPNDTYVHVTFTAWWETSFFCGVDGGCMDVWCTADDASISLVSDYVYVSCPGPGCNGPSPGDGWSSIDVWDYTPPQVMEDVWYSGVMAVHWEGGEFSFSDYVEESAFVQAAAIPVNMRLASSPYFPSYGHGEAPLKRLWADYVFDSSSGNRNDLGDCEVWEYKTFSGNTPPNSTFPGQTSPPTGQMTNCPPPCHPTTDGFFTDAHGTAGPLGTTDASYTVTQKFQFTCRGGPRRDFTTGGHKGPHDVARDVYGNGLTFRVSKHDSLGECALITSGQSAGWCQ